MTKYDSVNRRQREVKRAQIHPIWRGIGCALMVLIPIVSAALGKITADYGMEQGWIPYQLMGNPSLPKFIYASNALAQLLGPFTTWTNFYAYAAVAIVYMVVLGGILSVVNAFIYQIMGPSRWGPQDVPPPKVKIRGFRR